MPETFHPANDWKLSKRVDLKNIRLDYVYLFGNGDQDQKYRTNILIHKADKETHMLLKNTIDSLIKEVKGIHSDIKGRALNPLKDGALDDVQRDHVDYSDYYYVVAKAPKQYQDSDVMFQTSFLSLLSLDGNQFSKNGKSIDGDLNANDYFYSGVYANVRLAVKFYYIPNKSVHGVMLVLNSIVSLQLGKCWFKKSETDEKEKNKELFVIDSNYKYDLEEKDDEPIAFRKRNQKKEDNTKTHEKEE